MNNRKISAAIILIFSLIIAFTVALTQHSSETVDSFNDLYISDKDFAAFSASGNLSATPLSTEVYFNDELLIYDAVDNTFYYSLLEDDEAAFEPIVEIPNPDIKLLVYGEHITSETIAANTHLKLILTSGNTVSISDLVCTTLPLMNVTIDQSIIDANGYDDTYDILESVPSSIYLYDNRADFKGKSRTITSDSKIRRRGQTNAVNPSKSYRITLLKDKNDFDSERVKEDLLGLREDDDWILYSPYKDFEKVRNVFSMNLWYDSFAKDNEWKVPNGTQYKYLELFVNGHYHGLYALCYPIDKKQVKVKAGETLFKKMDWTQSERYTELEQQANGEWTLPGYAIKAGEYAYADLQFLYMNMFYSVDPAVIRRTSDVTNSIDFWLYLKFTQAADNIAAGSAKNMFVTVKNSDTGINGKKLLFTPWDMDQSWYHVGDGTTGLYSDPGYDLRIEFGTVDCLQLRGDENINDEIKERYAYLRKGPWSKESIMDALNEYDADIFGSGAFERTKLRWPGGIYMDSAVGMSDFKEYVMKRLECMDKFVEGL